MPPLTYISMAEDFVFVDEAAVLVLLPDDVVLPGVQFKTNHYSLDGTSGHEIIGGRRIRPCATVIGGESFGGIFSCF